MKQVSSEKSSLAWFKLAEFVTRGEKERALSIFRLLSHSLHNEALVSQLEGDILQSFNDGRAFDSYTRAANLYQKKGEDVQAIALYEQLSELFPPSEEVLMTLVTLYQKHHESSKSAHFARRLIVLLVSKDCFHEAHTVISLFQGDQKLKAPLHEQFALGILSYPGREYERPLVYTHIREALSGYLVSTAEQKDKSAIVQFLGTLAVLDKDAHNYACKYLTSKQEDDMIKVV